MGFPEVKISLDTSKDDLRAELYSPCLNGLIVLTVELGSSHLGG